MTATTTRRLPIRKHTAALATALATALAATALVWAAPGDAQPLRGDPQNGEKLLKGAKARVDGAWINRYPDAAILQLIASGKEGFPRVDSDNVLDRWDVIAALRAKNTDILDLVGDASHLFVAETRLDDNARTRLVDQAKLPAGRITDDRRVFVAFDTGEKSGGAPDFVTSKDSRKRDTLKRDKKVGYAVFAPLTVAGVTHEAAFFIDKDIKIAKVLVRSPDGGVPADVNQAAQRFVGKGARGHYAELKPNAGKGGPDIAKAISAAFLLAAESIYMYEIEERDYFMFE